MQFLLAAADGTIWNARRYRVAAPSIRIVPWAALASCWPLPQQLLPVSAAGGGRRRCTLRIFSGKNILNFGFQESLRTFLKPIFTRGVVNRNSICNACSLWKQRRCGQSYLFSSTAFPVKIAFGALRRARQTRNIGNSSAIHGQSASGGHSKSSRWMESHIFSKERIKSA